MCALSSSSRGAMLRRQRDPTNIVQEMINPKSRRNLSAAAFVSHVNGKSVGVREGLFTWLRDVFRKRAKNGGRVADPATVDSAPAVTTTTLDHPEIALSKRLAGFTRKVDVVNQKLANFGAARSTRKFEDGYRRVGVEEDNAEGRANSTTIQQLAIYARPQVPGRGEEIEGTSRRGALGFSWRGRHDVFIYTVVKTHRSGKADGATESAARRNLDASAHYRCYTSLRQYYRPSPRTKQSLPGSLNRNISVPMRAFAAFAPRNTKPPIREPNMPEKSERKDERKDERRDRKERKKPVIRTDRESVDSSERMAAIVPDDNPKDDPDAAFRYEWGVKLAEEPAADEGSDNDNFAEKGQQYVTRQLWGVSMKRPQPDVEGAVPSTFENPDSTEEHRNAFANLENVDTMPDGMKRNAAAKLTSSPTESHASRLKDTTAEYLSTSSSGDTATREDTNDADWPASSEELRKIMRMSPNMLKETIIVDNDYNVPEEAAVDAEITAWKNLVMKLKMPKKDFLSAERADHLEMVSTHPQSKVTKSIGDNYSSGKKMHTASIQIRHAHQDARNIVQRSNEALSVRLASAGIIAQTQHPKFTSAFSTNSEDSKREEIIDNKSSRQNERQTDSKSRDEKICNDANSSLGDAEPPSLHVEHETFSFSDQQQADTKVDLARTMNAIADEETEISLNRSQNINREITAPSFVLASSGSTGKEEDIHDDTEHEEDASYVDFNPTDGDLIKPHAIVKSRSVKETAKSTVYDKNVALDSNAEDRSDDPSNEYTTDTDDYVRIPGDPYPYSREHLEKWRASRSDGFAYKPIRRERSLFDSPSARPTPRNANGAGYASAAGTSRDSHAVGEVMETSGNGDDAKNVGPVNRFRVSSRDQRVVSDCPHGDAVDASGLRRSTAATAAVFASGKTSVAERGDNAPLRAYHQ